MKIAEDFQEKISADDPIILHWIDLLEDFEQKIELLKKLLSEAMTVRTRDAQSSPSLRLVLDGTMEIVVSSERV